MMRNMQQPSEDSEETKNLTEQIKVAIEEKDRLAEVLQTNKDALDERLRRLDQFTDDLIKIERAITRREDKIGRYDEQISAGKEKLEDLIYRQEQDRLYRE